MSPQDRCADDCVSLRRHRPHAPRGIAWNGNAEFQVFPPLLLRCSSGRHGDEAGTAKRRQWQPRVRVAGKAPRRKTLGDVSDLNCQTDAGKAHTNPGRQLQIRWADCRAAAHGSGSHADGQGSERAAKYDDVDDFVVVRAPSFHRDQQLSPHRGQPTHGMPPAHLRLQVEASPIGAASQPVMLWFSVPMAGCSSASTTANLEAALRAGDRPLEQRRTSGGKARTFASATPGDGAGSDTCNLRGVMPDSPPQAFR